MPSRPDLREISSNVKDAFADADRETLLDVLTFVLKEYVVEGPPPMLIHQAETLSDLQGASFATLIAALQTRFEHPELAMFVVDGENVNVRIGGVLQPLVGQRTPLAPPPAPVRVVETPVRQQRPADLAAAPPRDPAAAAPPPARGLSVRGRPSGDEAPAPAPAPAAPAAPAAAPAAAGTAAPSDKPEGASGDDASARFSLLELD